MTRQQLLNELPPYRDEWVTIKNDQNVRDIIREIQAAHKEFAPYYDKLALYFYDESIDKICESLYNFLKQNIKYHEEDEEDQTTAFPGGILTRGYGDCKHYASFAGGILDGIRRLTGKKIKWCYRFASYNFFDPSPHHVFVVVWINGKEIWIDPTPGATDKTPMWQEDKFIKADTMALRRNIANVADPSAEVVVFDPNEESDAQLSPELLSAIQLLLYYEVLDVNGNINDAQLTALQSQLPQDVLKQVIDARYLIQQQSTVGNIFTDIWRGIKKVTLFIPRNAYLSMVALNVFGLASKLKQAISTADGKKQIMDKWYSLGGTPDKLENAINSGATKAKILGIDNTIGVAAAVPAWVATASAIIAALSPIIKSVLAKQQQDNVPFVQGYDPSLLSVSDTGSSSTIMKYLPWVVAGGVVLYFVAKGNNKTVKGFNTTEIVVGLGAAYLVYKATHPTQDTTTVQQPAAA